MAVIQLAQALTLSPSVSPVCLPGPGVTSDNVPALVTGWGTLASGGDQPRVLQVFSIKYLLYGIWYFVFGFFVYFVFSVWYFWYHWYLVFGFWYILYFVFGDFGIIGIW